MRGEGPGMARWRWSALGIGGALVGGLPVIAAAPRLSVRALAPVDEVARGFEAPVGLAAGETSLLYVADRDAGTVTRLTPGGHQRVLLHRLDAPMGLAVEPGGALLVAEAGAGRVLRWEAAGGVHVLAGQLGRPRWLASDAATGTLLVAPTSGHRHDHGDGHRDRILARLGDGTLAEWVGGLPPVRGLVARGGALQALVQDRGAGGRLVRWPIGADGRPGLPATRDVPGLDRPRGLAVDALGAVFVSGLDPRGGHHGREAGLVLKGLPDGGWIVFATGLSLPRALAFDPAGHLYVTDEDDPGRLFRFRAPAAPVVAWPAVTALSPAVLSGQ